MSHYIDKTLHELDRETFLLRGRAQQVESDADHARVCDVVGAGQSGVGKRGVRAEASLVFAVLAEEHREAHAVHELGVGVGDLEIGVLVEDDMIEQLGLESRLAHQAAFGAALAHASRAQVRIVFVHSTTSSALFYAYFLL